jgi:phosphoribosylamine-glycine ligase
MAALEKTGAKVFISGAVLANDPPLKTSGGRVLTVSALGANADEAYSNAYKGMEAIRFTGMGFRKDIGRENK